MDNIDRFVAEISRNVFSRVFNPWHEHCHHDVHVNAPELRRQRLAMHLRARNVRFLGVGEAPGFAGCRYSGIPFVSEKLLMNGAIPRVSGIHGSRITDRKDPFSEPSATIVWTTLYELGIAEETVLWNAFPFHPFDGEVWSNRTPTDTELAVGAPFLRALLDLYRGVKVIAIGKKAAGSLAKLGIARFEEIRHPSMGGKAEFQAGMRRCVRNT